MPKIMVQASPAHGEAGLVTLTERIVAANLASPHYTTQLIQRLSWAAADAEAVESQARTGDPERKALDAPVPVRERVTTSTPMSAGTLA
jgi:hypothetical protein